MKKIDPRALPEGYQVATTSVHKATHSVQLLNISSGDIVRATSTNSLGDAYEKAVAIINARNTPPPKEFV